MRSVGPLRATALAKEATEGGSLRQAGRRPKATKGFRFTTSAVQTVPDTGFESPRLLQMPLILKFVCQLCCWLSQKQPDRARLGLPVLSFPYITKWVDAHTNLPTRARWIAKADVALY